MEALVERLAKERAGGIVSLHHAWRQSNGRLASSGLRAEQVERLAACLEQPGEANALAHIFGSHSSSTASYADFGRLVRMADESHHSLREWVRALIAFFEWLEKHNRRTDIPCALGYISCCDESVGMNGENRSLPHAVESLLEEYGYEGR